MKTTTQIANMALWILLLYFLGSFIFSTLIMEPCRVIVARIGSMASRLMQIFETAMALSRKELFHKDRPHGHTN